MEIEMDKSTIIVNVQNAEGEPDTKAEIVVQNQINYTPKVSVIIPVYNVEQYLHQCLDSVVNQTLREIEIICVDDGSTDSSLDILKEYAAKDNRITILKQANLHAGVARNAGLAVAKGEYIHFLDADDLYPANNTLKHLYNGAQKHNVLICGGSLCQLKNNELITDYQAFDSHFSFNEDKIVNFIDYQFIYGYWRFIYNRNFLKKNHIVFPKYIRFQDPIFCLRALHLAKCFYALKEPTYVYRVAYRTHIFSGIIANEMAKGIKDVLDFSFANNLSKVYTDMYARLHSKDMKAIYSKHKIDGKNYLQYFGPQVPTDQQLENIDELLSKNLLISRLTSREYFKYLADNPQNVEDYPHITQPADVAFIHGSGTWYPQPETVEYAIKNNIPLIKIEDGFLRSADTWCNNRVNPKYTMGISFTYTNDVFYFDATRSSYMERQINNPNFKLSQQQKERAQNAIRTIVTNYLTKYNHQPIYEPQIGRPGVQKILIVDQSYGDFSIKQGLADDNTFTEMLETAIKENPNADIIIKTHPDAIAPGTNKPLGYYSTIEEHDNIYTLREPINPIALLKYVDKVYVCTTQFGFEALMCGKEVHTFGMPFYAGWGLTIDKLKNPRRTTKRTLEELFYIAYIKNTRYVDPESQKICSIERAMEYLIELRKEYQQYKLSQNNIKVSVIVPVYNVENYLPMCLDSIVNQTLKNIEIICINDGSTDDSATILQQYALKDLRIKVFTQSNKGLGATRNIGVHEAKGKYIFFCDSDDFIKPETLENLYNKIEETQADLCQYLLQTYYQSDGKINIRQCKLFDVFRLLNKYEYTYKDCPNLLFEQVEAVLKLYRKDFLLENNIKFAEGCFFEDTIVHIKAIALAKKICLEDNAYYFYRKNRIGQITDQSVDTEKNLDTFNYINEAEEFFISHNMFNGEVQNSYYKFAIDRIIRYYSRCSDSVKYQYAQKAKLWARNKDEKVLKQSVPNFNEFKNIIQTTNNKDTKKLQKTPSSTPKKYKNITPSPNNKTVKVKKTEKMATNYKLFNFIPLYTHKQRGGKEEWKVFGLPIWKIRKIENTGITKCYLFGIPFIKISKKKKQLT